MEYPDISPKLTRDGPDAYVGTYQFTSASRSFRIERDGDEWIRIDLRQPSWYPTLKAFRRKVAITNIHRWLNFGHRNDGKRGETEARRFIDFVMSYPGVERCRGEQRSMPIFGAYVSHSGCCEHFGPRHVVLPEGKDALDLYLEWKEQA